MVFSILGATVSINILSIRHSLLAEIFSPNQFRQKKQIAVDTHQKGWMAQGMSQLSGAKTHDLKEVFFWGTDLASDDPDILANKPLMSTNQWPTASFPRLQEELLPYYDALCDVAKTLMSIVAVSLDQSKTFFDACYQKPLARGQLVFYPPSTEIDEAQERYGVAPHTDFGVFNPFIAR